MKVDDFFRERYNAYKTLGLVFNENTRAFTVKNSNFDIPDFICLDVYCEKE